MPNIGPMIAASAQLGLGYAERLLKDVTPERFARFAEIGDTKIQSNHPAFIYGHLSLYSSRIISAAGGNAAAFEPSEAFNKVFSKDAQCVDDIDGTIYPAMEEITATLIEGGRAAVDVLNGAADDVFLLDNTNEAMRAKFPTVGAMVGFYVGGHFMLHMGQMSAWRRAEGLGPA